MINLENVSSSNIKYTLEDVHNIYAKHYKIDDFARIDAALAVSLAVTKRGVPLWVIFIGASGDAKSEFLKPIQKWDECFTLGTITRNTLMSGQHGVNDLVEAMDRKVVLTYDLAALLQKDAKEKAEIFGQLRDIYDGKGYKSSGSGKMSQHDDLYFNWLAASTTAYDSQIIISQQLGSRELLFRIQSVEEDYDDKMDKALENEGAEHEIREEVAGVVVPFLQSRRYQNIAVSKDIKLKMKEYARELSKMRAAGAFDSYNGELRGDMCPEVPTRIVQQLQRVYRALKCLDPDYPDEEALRIIKHFCDSSGDPYRIRVRDFLKNNPMTIFSAYDVAKSVGIGCKTAVRELNALWGMKMITRYGEEIVTDNKVWEKVTWQWGK
jgi:hypothetical protein